MSPENFAYFLQGYFEISGATYLSEAQTQVVKDHLDLVFNKVTPNRTTATLLDKLDQPKNPIEVCSKPKFDEMYKKITEGRKEERYC
jgi:hypothetical protein